MPRPHYDRHPDPMDWCPDPITAGIQTPWIDALTHYHRHLDPMDWCPDPITAGTQTPWIDAPTHYRRHPDPMDPQLWFCVCDIEVVDSVSYLSFQFTVHCVDQH